MTILKGLQKQSQKLENFQLKTDIEKKHYEDVYENAIIHYDFATYKLPDFLNKFYYNQKDDCDSMALIQ